MEEKENMKVLTTWGRLASRDKIALIALLIVFQLLYSSSFFLI